MSTFLAEVSRRLEIIQGIAAASRDDDARADLTAALAGLRADVDDMARLPETQARAARCLEACDGIRDPGAAIIAARSALADFIMEACNAPSLPMSVGVIANAYAAARMLAKAPPRPA